MGNSRGRLVAATVIASVAVGVGGCGDDGRTATTTDFLGSPTVRAYAQMGLHQDDLLPPDFGVVTYEMSPVVTGKPSPDFGTGSAVPSLVVAACWSDTPRRQLTLGVVPMADSTPRIVATARARGYDRFLHECPGTATTFTVPPPPELP